MPGVRPPGEWRNFSIWVASVLAPPSLKRRSDTLAIRAAGALLQYVRDTQKSAVPHIRAMRVEERADSLGIDAATRRNLELDTSLSGNEAATLFAVLHSSVTAMGSRALRRWLNRPIRAQVVLREPLHLQGNRYLCRRPGRGRCDRPGSGSC